MVAFGSGGVFALIEMSLTLMIRGNLLMRSKKSPEVVIRPLRLQPVRNLRVELLLDGGQRGEALDRQVRLCGQSLDAAQDVGDVLFLWQHLFEVVETLLQLHDLRFELRKAARGRNASGDIPAKRR